MAPVTHPGEVPLVVPAPEGLAAQPMVVSDPFAAPSDVLSDDPSSAVDGNPAVDDEDIPIPFRAADPQARPPRHRGVSPGHSVRGIR